MFNNKTTIVVGAGASSEANLPIGMQLKGEISRLLDFRFEHGIRRISGDDLIYEAINNKCRLHLESGYELQKYCTASKNIKEALPQAISIDNFLDSHQGNEKLELCGKLAIVRSILKAEKSSSLYIDFINAKNTLNYAALENTWLNTFMMLLTQSCKINQIEERLSKIQFVIFNYDRCIEHFLYHSLQNFYHIKSDDAADLVKNIRIFHPYGVVGNLPWYSTTNPIEFGREPSVAELLSLVKDIKTFTEGTDPSSSNIQDLKASVSESKILLFLGFAYHSQNMDLLAPEIPIDTKHDKKSFGTAFGMSLSDCEIVRDEIINSFGVTLQNVTIRNDLRCNALFNEYWRSLSLS